LADRRGERLFLVQVEALAVMQSASSLTHLSLSRATGVTDNSIDVLSDFTRLKRLDLSFCSVTEPGLQGLQPLQQLNRLEIHGCGLISDKERALYVLSQQLPNLKYSMNCRYGKY
jgi:hypothetical protein